MKSITTFALALTILAGASVVGLDTAEAHGGKGFGFRGGMHNNENTLVPQELREEWRAEKREMLADLTQEERQAYREEHRAEKQEYREAKKEAFEEFVGLEKEEIRELKQDGQSMGEILEGQGISEDEAEEFLTERANEKVDFLVEKHDLGAVDEQTLRDRIANFVQSILDRWFGE